MFRQEVFRWIEERHLLLPGERVLVALSGGADSVALLCVLQELGYRLEAAHCNFHLRGEESDRDERFVRQLCERRQIPLHVIHFSTGAYAASRKISIEMAARELRYRWFEELRDQGGFRVVAVAHHRDDSVETLLLNLTRGTGINGLRGIRPVNGMVVRPLLGVSREAILTYLDRLGQPYVTDSTNLEDAYARNKIRLNVLPALREINPSVAESIAETASRLDDVAEIYRHAMQEACCRVCPDGKRISIPALLKEVAPQAVLFELLHGKGFNASQIRDILRSLSGESGRLFQGAGWTLLRDREYLFLRSDAEESILSVLQERIVPVEDLPVLPREKEVACLDADRITWPLELRVWSSGDRFIPLGMQNYKKVRDYLRDRKMSLFEKEKQQVVVSGGEIVWLVNERIDQRFRVTGQTRRVLLLQVREERSGETSNDLIP